MHRLHTSHDSLAVRAHKFSTGAALSITGKHLLTHGQNVFWGMLITISWNKGWLDSFILLPVLFYCEDSVDLIKGPQTVKTGRHMPAQRLTRCTVVTPCCSILLDSPLQFTVAAELIVIIHLLFFVKHKSTTPDVHSPHTWLDARLNVDNFHLHIPPSDRVVLYLLLSNLFS